jgi:hypothetical protein
MRNLLVAVTITLGSLGLASVQASPVVPGSMTSAVEALGGVEAVHCTPNKRHHIPTWNYRADGCRRPARKKAPAKAKAPPPKSS